MKQFLAIQVVVILLLAFSCWGRTLINPKTAGEITVEYTPQGIPFITAATERDLFYGQGYIVAENRMWQIESFRRWALGTTAEVFGEITLQLDISSRRMQWLQICQQNINNTPPSYLVKIQYYMDGVNAFLDACQQDPTLLPPEFATYGAPFPAPYNIIDAFLIVKVFATGLSGDARSEPGNQYLLNKVGPSRYQEYMARDPAMPFIVPPYAHSNYSRAGSDVPFKATLEHVDLTDDQKRHLANATQEFVLSGKPSAREPHMDSKLGEFLKIFNPPEFTRASNSWVIHGDHTVSGLPIFANDPHLSYTAPIVWILLGLHCTDPASQWQHIVGATLVLAPGVGIGRNEHVAWGYTMVQGDNQDLFIMNNVPGNNSQYYYNSTIYNYEITTTQINIKNQSPVNVTLTRSVYGPVIINGDGTYYSLHWTAQYPIEPSIQALIDQNVAQSQQQYIQAASKWWSLCFNAGFADTQGNIGYHASGAIPHRQPGDTGKLPKVGDGSKDWLGLIPFDELPNFLNPDQGFIVTANNPLAPESSEQIPVQGNFAIGFRAQRIIDMITDQLSSGQKIDVNYTSSIQGSVVDLQFSYLYPSIQRLVLSGSSDLNWQQKLVAWDGNELVTSKESTIFAEYVRCLYNVTFYEAGSSWDDPYLMARIFNNASTTGANDDPSCGYWGTTCLAYASSCFSSAVALFPVRVPEWGSIPHYATFFHILPLPNIKENLFASVGGSGYTPNAAHSAGARGPVVAGPSLRFIADMSGNIPNQMVLPGGVSGDPRSPHYADQLPFWQKVQTLDVDWSYFATQK